MSSARLLIGPKDWAGPEHQTCGQDGLLGRGKEEAAPFKKSPDWGLRQTSLARLAGQMC